MHIDITFKNIDPSDALKDYAKKRLTKIGKFIDRPAEAHVILSVEKIRHKAEVTLNADGVIINAIEITEDMYSAIDIVMEKLERQVKKHKEKAPGQKARGKKSGRGSPGKTGKEAQGSKGKRLFRQTHEC